MNANVSRGTTDTIVAIATPVGRGGIGVVRVSGNDLLPLALAILGRIPVPRQALYSVFRDADAQPIDQGVALYFPAPASYQEHTA